MAITITPRSDGELINAAKYNGDRQEIVNGMLAANVGSHSATAVQMRIATDPGELGSESLPGTIDGELERLRFTILEHKQLLDPALTQWYETPEIGGSLSNAACRLVYTNATTLTLQRWDGRTLSIDGAPREIPEAGIAIPSAGLAANTTYTFFAHWTAGAMAVIPVSGVPSVFITPYGMRGSVIANPQFTLVGMARTNASNQFDDSPAKRNVASYFNRRLRVAEVVDTSLRTTGATTLVERHVSARGEFVTWAAEVPFTVWAKGNSSVQQYLSPALDGAAVTSLAEAPYISESSGHGILTMSASASVAEGHHTFGQMIAVGSGTGTWAADKNRSTALLSI